MATAEKTSRRRRTLIGSALAVAAASLVALAALLPAVLQPVPDVSLIDAAQLSGKDKLDLLNGALQQQNAVRAILVQSIVGLAALSGAVPAWRQYVHLKTEAVRREQEKRDEFAPPGLRRRPLDFHPHQKPVAARPAAAG
ncbi:hypothetical protein [Amycolatopsis sp. lyj-109]|uniref:hypothetical protein n=1 Tax=Amycolatopsis sp. lyj-109 TaxID=2789287 RepID=UPI00397C26BE